MRDDDPDLLSALRRYVSRPRTHASFFDWTDKRVKEAGLVDDFLEPNNHQGQHQFAAFDIPEHDPPDATLYDGSSQSTALEIAELVSEATIRAQIEHDKVQSVESARAYAYECEKWADRSYFEAEINRWIETKNRKCDALFSAGSPVHLLLHSDEMYVETCYSDHLAAGIELDFQRFGRVWLMLSAMPISGICPLIELTRNA